ncbi:MAG: hypothetical protein QM723_07020 [Myxococcaceae bacterium]
MSGGYSFTENASVTGAAYLDLMNPVNWADKAASYVTGSNVNLPGSSTFGAEVAQEQFEAHGDDTSAANAQTHIDAGGADALSTTGAAVEQTANDVADKANKVGSVLTNPFFIGGVAVVALVVLVGPAFWR